MNFTYATGISIVVICVTVILIKLIVSKYVTGSLEKYLLLENYAKLDAFLDSLLCKITYPPYTREIYRLNGYFLQNDSKKIHQQIEYMLSHLKLSEEQEHNILIKSFYYYMEQKEYQKAKQILRRLNKSTVYKMLEITYEVIAEKSFKYIAPLIEASKGLDEHSKQKIMIEYLLGIQYTSKKEYVLARNSFDFCLQYTDDEVFKRNCLEQLNLIKEKVGDNCA